MPPTPTPPRMVTAPHHLAASAGLDILREGGTAVGGDGGHGGGDRRGLSAQ